jgi:metal-dependent amidase/aminoacylase/carboxypeptidase family protein
VKLRIVTAAIGVISSCVLPAAAAVDRARVEALEVHTGIAHTGAMSELKGGLPGPTVVLRTDMDGR